MDITYNIVTVGEILDEQSAGKLRLSQEFIEELSGYDRESVVIPLPNDPAGSRVIVMDKDKAKCVIAEIKKQFEALLQE